MSSMLNVFKKKKKEQSSSSPRDRSSATTQSASASESGPPLPTSTEKEEKEKEANGDAGTETPKKETRQPTLATTGNANGDAIASPSTPKAETGPSRARPTLNLEQRHYLLKTLVQMRMQRESADLEKLGTLTLYGYPFQSTRPKLSRIKKEVLKDLSDFNYGNKDEGGQVHDEQHDETQSLASSLHTTQKSNSNPNRQEATLLKSEGVIDPFLLRHFFHVHAHTFPGFDGAPLKFWRERLQPFFDEMAARNFSTSYERTELAKRQFFTLVMTRFLGSFAARGVGVRGPGETKGSGRGVEGSEKWGVGKQWGKGTVKRGLEKPARITPELMEKIDDLFGNNPKELDAWKRAGKEWHRISADWRAFKETVIEKETGIDEMVKNLDIARYKNLPPHLRNCVEYARVFVAYMIHSLFVDLPNADGLFNILKTIHTLFPYRLAKLGLKVANAELYVRPLISLFLARPAGSKSLLQRFFASSVNKEMSIFKQNAEIIKKAINDPTLTKRIEAYVSRGSRPERRAMRAKADEDGIDIVSAILIYSGSGSSTSSKQQGSPSALSSQQKDEILRMENSYVESVLRGDLDAAYPTGTTVNKNNSRRPSVPPSSDALKFAQLKLLLREELRRRDREQALAVGSGSLVPTLLKDLLELVFFDALRKVSQATDLSQHLGHLQLFLDDLIEVKKKQDNSLEAWIALCARHEQSLYFLVHEIAHIAGPMWDWCQAGADYMSLGTIDPYHPADRKVGSIEVDIEKLLQDPRLTDEDVKNVIKEVDDLIRFTRWTKIRSELEMRRNFLLSRPDAAPTSGLCSDDIPTKEMKEKIQDIDSMMRELLRSEGLEEDRGMVPNPQRGTEMGEYPGLHFSIPDPLRQHVSSHENNDAAQDLRYEPSLITAPYPSLWATRKVLEPFSDKIKSQLPDWKQYDKEFKPRARPPKHSKY